MYDMLFLAFQTDSTRVATFLLANEWSNRTFPDIGITEGHHNLSHHQNKKDNAGEDRRDRPVVHAAIRPVPRAAGRGEGRRRDIRCFTIR